MKSFPILRYRNARLFFLGHAVSQAGTWMNAAALAWLVLELTGSGAAVGLAISLQAGPVLFLGPMAGLVVDRSPRYGMALSVQVIMGVIAGALGVLTVSGHVQVWHVYVLSLGYGVTRAFEIPARQSFVIEIVGRDMLRNAITLQALVNNIARVAGPALAGLIIAGVGTWLCFLLNAASYGVIVGLFVAIDRSKLSRNPVVTRAPGQLREGFRHAMHTPVVRSILLMMVAGGIFIQQYQTFLPVLAQRDLGGGPEAFGLLMSGLGAGAVVGGLVTARKGWVGIRTVSVGCLAAAVALTLLAISPTLMFGITAMVMFGAANIMLLTTANSTVQLAAGPELQGRLIALYASANVGSTALGAPLIGWLCDTIGARQTLAVAASAGALICVFGFIAVRRTSH